MSLHKKIRVVLKGWQIYRTDLQKGRIPTYSQMTVFKALEAIKNVLLKTHVKLGAAFCSQVLSLCFNINFLHQNINI